jgi:hypothetical protein
MTFDITPQGTVKLLSVLDYETAIVAETGCAIRLRLLDRMPGPDAVPTIVQLAMTVEQAAGLRDDLQIIIDNVIPPPLENTSSH